jgi:hypothetical protein
MQRVCVLRRHLWPQSPPNFSTLFHKRHDFREGEERVIERKMYVSIFSKSLAKNVSISKKNLARFHKCRILMKTESSRQIFEKNLHIKFHQNPPVGIKLFHANGQTDIKLEVAFRNSANSPNKRTEG